MAQAKRTTRGIKRETRTTSRPEFKPVKERYKGLNHARLVKVESTVSENPIKDDSALVEFRGLKMPAIVFHFEGVVEAGNESPYKADRFTPHVPGSDADNKYGEADDSKLKHYIETFLPNEMLTDAHYDKLAVIDKINDLDPEAETYGQQVLDIYHEYYDAIAEIMNGEEGKKPIYQDKDIFLKILFITFNTGKGRYEIPMYVGQGIIELVKRDKEGKVIPPTRIKIAVGKGETIEEKISTPSNGAALPGGAGGNVDATFLP